MGVAGETGDEVLSDIGSKDNENAEVDGLGVGREEGEEMSWTWTSPSNRTECLRACGWFTGTVADRAKGDGT